MSPVAPTIHRTLNATESGRIRELADVAGHVSLVNLERAGRNRTVAGRAGAI